MSWKNPTGAEPVPGTSPSLSLNTLSASGNKAGIEADNRLGGNLRTSQRRIPTLSSRYPVGRRSK
jgi:hypothetical protein